MEWNPVSRVDSGFCQGIRHERPLSPTAVRENGAGNGMRPPSASPIARAPSNHTRAPCRLLIRRGLLDPLMDRGGNRAHRQQNGDGSSGTSADIEIRFISQRYCQDGAFPEDPSTDRPRENWETSIPETPRRQLEPEPPQRIMETLSYRDMTVLRETIGISSGCKRPHYGRSTRGERDGPEDAARLQHGRHGEPLPLPSIPHASRSERAAQGSFFCI